MALPERADSLEGCVLMRVVECAEVRLSRLLDCDRFDWIGICCGFRNRAVADRNTVLEVFEREATVQRAEGQLALVMRRLHVAALRAAPPVRPTRSPKL